MPQRKYISNQQKVRAKASYDFLKKSPSSVFGCKQVVEGIGLTYPGERVSVKASLMFLVSLGVVKRVMNAKYSYNQENHIVEDNNQEDIRKEIEKEMKDVYNQGYRKALREVKSTLRYDSRKRDALAHSVIINYCDGLEDELEE